MTKHGFFQGIGVGVLAGAAIGMAVASAPSCGAEVRRMTRKAARTMDHMKDPAAAPQGVR